MDMAGLHWLRPLWLWALLLLPLWAWWAVHRARHAGIWHGVVDAHLLPYLLDTTPAPSRRRSRWLAATAYALAVIALAGPSWRQVEQPLWREHAPLVIALDLSSATLQRDLPPSRLAQARTKLATLLQHRQGGQVGLVAYAGDAFTVAPITDDAANVAVFLDALAPDVMPVDGQRVDRALAWSTKLLQQAGFTQGEILVMGDHATAADIVAASTAAERGARVSVLGVGSSAAGGWDEPSLRKLADAGRGGYQRITLDDADLRALGVLAPQASGAHGSTGANGSGRHWLDEGFWVIPLVMLFVLPAFRRGASVALLALVVAWPMGTVRAADWWRRADQVQYAAMEAAAQQYRRGEFEDAARGFAQADTADAHYNRGNALAKAGRYADAIHAYDQALRRAPGMRDAEANRRAVQAALQRRPLPGTNQPSNGTQGGANSRSSESSQGPGAGLHGAGPPDAGQAPSSGGKPSGEGASSGAAGPRRRDGSVNGAQAATDTSPPERSSAVSPDGAQADGSRGSHGKGADAVAQAKADAAQRERMQQALAQRGGGPGQTNSRPGPGETAAERERRIANEAWLRRVPDDPGGLLREKFRLEYQRRLQQGAKPP